jgi:hypothetical protein
MQGILSPHSRLVRCFHTVPSVSDVSGTPEANPWASWMCLGPVHIWVVFSIWHVTSTHSRQRLPVGLQFKLCCRQCLTYYRHCLGTYLLSIDGYQYRHIKHTCTLSFHVKMWTSLCFQNIMCSKILQCKLNKFTSYMYIRLDIVGI